MEFGIGRRIQKKGIPAFGFAEIQGEAAKNTGKKSQNKKSNLFKKQSIQELADNPFVKPFKTVESLKHENNKQPSTDQNRDYN